MPERKKNLIYFWVDLHNQLGCHAPLQIKRRFLTSFNENTKKIRAKFGFAFVASILFKPFLALIDELRPKMESHWYLKPPKRLNKNYMPFFNNQISGRYLNFGHLYLGFFDHREGGVGVKNARFSGLKRIILAHF